ncbi:hypothetical protein ACG74X_19390 [Marivita sp. S0852]|uniref:hypothetical protein n=1 Tax=Marivita sp. S0852 TaxID=3373893 RepID=UPI003981EEE0
MEHPLKTEQPELKFGIRCGVLFSVLRYRDGPLSSFPRRKSVDILMRKAISNQLIALASAILSGDLVHCGATPCVRNHLFRKIKISITLSGKIDRNCHGRVRNPEFIYIKISERKIFKKIGIFEPGRSIRPTL